ncbi:MAG TPA: hypothetical protein VHG33_05070 [Woeseiaceae bacterium]|nr:hypothetical protein [Woeseiaceae bacterium]
MSDSAPGLRGFEFLCGEWIVQGRRRLEPGCDRWERFDAIQRCWPLLNGLGNVDEIVREDDVAISASLRLFEPRGARWTVYKLRPRDGVAVSWVQGSFRNGMGEFFGEQQREGGSVKVRERWLKAASATPVWDRAVSGDGGRTWELSSTMELARVHWPFESAAGRMAVPRPIRDMAVSF